jgi:uncharacterized protein (DUF305 family)
MKISSHPIRTAALLTAVLVTGCGPAAVASPPRAVQPGAPGEASRVAAAPQAALGERRHVEADARFMEHMIHHHAQALAMTALVPTRSSRDDIRLLAQRIEVSQRDEIAQMRRWLEARGVSAPRSDTLHAHHGVGGEHAAMAGMLSPAEMARLAAATGSEFDRLFLELMIRHHEGALTMVAELFGTPGAGQDTDVFRIASEVDADQEMEITRMRRLLSAPAPGR